MKNAVFWDIKSQFVPRGIEVEEESANRPRSNSNARRVS
jgi:hypothetical protein